MKKTIIKPIDGEFGNSVGAIIHGVAWFVIIIGFIIGLTFIGESFLLAIVYFVAFAFSGVMLLGFAEIIRLLQRQQSQQYEIFIEDDSKEAPAAEDQYAEPVKSEPARPISTVHDAGFDDAKVAHVKEDSGFVYCPICNHKQNANRSLCYHCGARFVFDGK